jgi:hypothetical protein
MPLSCAAAGKAAEKAITSARKRAERESGREGEWVRECAVFFMQGFKSTSWIEGLRQNKANRPDSNQVAAGCPIRQ